MSSKLLKSELKEIVKECLVEILSDGIDVSSSNEKTETVVNESRTLNTRRSSFDHAEWSRNTRSENFKNDYREDAQMLSDDPILIDVLADSHKTLQEQIQAESMGASALSGDFAAREAASSDPESLFEGASKNWAMLAFDK
jgi:hypothetical protein